MFDWLENNEEKNVKLREEGIEPPTAGSGIQRSTTELFPQHWHHAFQSYKQ